MNPTLLRDLLPGQASETEDVSYFRVLVTFNHTAGGTPPPREEMLSAEGLVAFWEKNIGRDDIFQISVRPLKFRIRAERL